MFRRKGPSEVAIAHENEVKIGITHELSTALKMVQKENIGTEDQSVYSTDTANSVCNCIEAVLLHGLKSKAVTKIASYVGLGHEATSQPSLNFWNFVSRFTHGEVIAQLKHLAQITTEIGLCRAWVRVALNDGLMESYIDAMVSDKKNLEYFYHRTAYLRDSEQPGIMQTYLQGLMNFQFKLSFNASVLNEWTYPPLLLAGIIDAKDAPPPVIKPAANKPPKPSKSEQKEKSSELIVEVRSGKSRSYGSRDYPDNLEYNPMEQPKFGQPPDSSYYVTSSEFTSKDVEEFKKFSKHVHKPVSECSGSSLVSAPDPPQMNVSPAAYVEKYGVQIGSPTSVITDKSEENSIDIEHLSDNYGLNPASDQNLDSVVPAESNSAETESSLSKDALEESWEEFYKSPLKKVLDEVNNAKPLQRLDSINRDAKEEAILSSIVDEDAIDDLKTLVQSNTDEFDDGYENTLETIDKNLVIPDAYHSGGQIVQNEHKAGEDLDVYDVCEASNSEGSKLLDESQKLLHELGIADTCSEVKDTSENHQEEEMVYGSPKTKAKKKSAPDRLKPMLSLSPPRSDIVEPELSDAVADKVDQIKSPKDNAGYLSRHRLSLQYTGIDRKILDKSGHRKSLPDLLEHNENMAESFYSIEDHLYNGLPLDDAKKKTSGAPVEYEDSDDNAINKQNDEGPSEEEIKRHMQDKRNSVGNSLMLSGRGWSSSFESEGGDTVGAFSPPRTAMSLPITRPKTESFGSLLQNYTPASSLSARSVDDVLNSLPNRKDTVYSPENQGSSENEVQDYFEDFEVVTNTSTDPDPNDKDKLKQLLNIANEKGLDAQNFQCKGCSRSIGLIFGKPRTCKFDGGYYCYECHENDEYYIPALIVHNWDFRKHKVAKRNLQFLMDNEEQPHLNIEQINPRLYDHVQEMQEIKSLRLQLMLLKTYLFTCKQSVAEDLRKLIWPRDYLYENTEVYSLADLLQIPSGALASSVRKLIKFATKHVYSCRLCSQKGFICELCNNPKVIYAFEMDATYRCPQCKTVFHKECKTDNRPCPKCQRRQSRQTIDGSSAVILTPDYDLQSVE